MESETRWTVEPVNGWPFGALEEDWHARRSAWREVTEKDWWYALECLPPIYLAGGFMLGEPYSHTVDDEGVYAAYVQVGERCFARYTTRSRFPGERRGLLATLERGRMLRQVAGELEGVSDD